MRVRIPLVRIASKTQNLNWRQLINNRTNSFEESWHRYIVYILGELICRPFFFTIFASEFERFDGVVVEGGHFSIDHRIMTVDSQYPMIVRDREIENLSMKLFFTLCKSEEFDNTSHCQGHAMSILSVRNIKRHSAALNLTCKKQEVHIVYTHKEQYFREVTNKRLDFFKLIFGECNLLESNSIVGLRTRHG